MDSPRTVPGLEIACHYHRPVKITSKLGCKLDLATLGKQGRSKGRLRLVFLVAPPAFLRATT